MGKMKEFAENVSEEMGFDGVVNEAVLVEGQRRLSESQPEFAYEVKVLVDFTMSELDMLKRCMMSFGDAAMAAEALQGGFLYGWINRCKMGLMPTKCSLGKMDLCLKSLEIITMTSFDEYRVKGLEVQRKLQKLYTQTCAEYNRVNSGD